MPSASNTVGDPRRDRIRAAAWDLLLKRGPGHLSTAELARCAGVSKRDIYGLFGSKSALLSDCVAARTQEMRRPLAHPSALDREALAAALGAFGTAVLETVTSRPVLTLYRLALAEAERAPDIAAMLEDNGRNANRAALANLLARAQGDGLLGDGEPPEMASMFLSLLWDDLLVRLLLGTARAPDAAEIDSRVRSALAAFMRLFGPEEGSKEGSSEPPRTRRRRPAARR
jgi:AcrR family transcriptional regulator